MTGPQQHSWQSVDALYPIHFSPANWELFFPTSDLSWSALHTDGTNAHDYLDSEIKGPAADRILCRRLPPQVTAERYTNVTTVHSKLGTWGSENCFQAVKMTHGWLKIQSYKSYIFGSLKRPSKIELLKYIFLICCTLSQSCTETCFLICTRGRHSTGISNKLKQLCWNMPCVDTKELMSLYFITIFLLKVLCETEWLRTQGSLLCTGQVKWGLYPWEDDTLTLSWFILPMASAFWWLFFSPDLMLFQVNSSKINCERPLFFLPEWTLKWSLPIQAVKKTMGTAKQFQNKNPISPQLSYHKNMSTKYLDGLNTSIDPLNIQQIFPEHMPYAKNDSRYCGAVENKRHRYHLQRVCNSI